MTIDVGTYHHSKTMLDSPPLSSQMQWFPGVVESISDARHFVVGSLYVLGCSNDVRDDAALVTTELATNAVLHAHSDFVITITHVGSAIEVEVFDGSPVVPVKFPASQSATHGRGLLIVDKLAHSWKVNNAGPGKSVCAQLECAHTSAPTLSHTV